MKHVLLCLFFFTVAIAGFGQNRTGNFEMSTKREGHTATISFTVVKFDFSEHEIVGLDTCHNNFRAVKIDGKSPLGTSFCDMPDEEIQAMKLVFDGKEIDFPKELYSDCYSPPFFRTDNISRYFSIRIGDDLKSVFVFMSGGDGSGSYQVLWVLRPDGNHSRLTDLLDCQFIDFSRICQDEDQ